MKDNNPPPKKRKGAKYSRNYIIDCYTRLGMLNARKGICGELVSKAQLKRGFVWFSKLPRLFTAEIVLEAYIAS